MKFEKNIILFSSILIMFTSSRAQSQIAGNNLFKKEFIIGIGDRVLEISKDIWVIYQDRKNNYWFGSNTHGAYRYDGKTLTHFSTKDGLCNDNIKEIKEDKFGNIYFNTLGGVSLMGKNLSLCL